MIVVYKVEICDCSLASEITGDIFRISLSSSFDHQKGIEKKNKATQNPIFIFRREKTSNSARLPSNTNAKTRIIYS